jgi:hypothetical protein
MILQDDTDSTIVIEEEEDGVFIYTANEVDKRCANGKASKADCNIRKFNALQVNWYGKEITHVITVRVSTAVFWEHLCWARMI